MLPAALIASGIAAAESVPASELSGLFVRYNPAVWPGHVIAYVLTAVALGLLMLRPGVTASRATAGLLAAMWLWLGVVFHGMYATDLDPVLGTIYAVLFVLQAVLLLRSGVLRDGLTFTTGRGATGALGWLSLAYALIAYPLIGVALGHGYPEAPLLGMAPCPTTIATFGFLLLARPPLPRHLLAIPLVWAILGPLGAVPQGMTEDVGLFVIGVVATVSVFSRDRGTRSPRSARPTPAERADGAEVTPSSIARLTGRGEADSVRPLDPSVG